jgi:hypothetical protein
MKAIFEAAAKEARAYIAMKYEASFDQPFYEGTHWALPIPQETLKGLQTGIADPK